MSPQRRAELLMVIEILEGFPEARVSGKVVASALLEVISWCDFLTRANHDLAGIEEKIDELREKLATAEKDRDLLAERLAARMAAETIASFASPIGEDAQP